MLKEGMDYKLLNEHSFMLCIDGKEEEIALKGYEFLSVLGSGANGVTIKAHSSIVDRLVAIKVWKPRENKNSDYEQQFLGEVQKIAKLKHKNIATVYTGDILDCGICYAVYEFIDGITLKNWLVGQLREEFGTCNRSEQEKISMCRSILNAVLYYQSEGIIHGDLHDRNILVSVKDNEPHIIDFVTSTLPFNSREKGQERELYFIAKLVEGLLKDCRLYSEEHFAFKIDDKNKRITIKNDTCEGFNLDFTPKLMTETMLGYTEIMHILSCIPTLDLEVLPDLCGFISQTKYLDIKALMRDLEEKTLDEKARRSFPNVIAENIETATFPNFIRDASDEERAGKMFDASFCAYCELAQKITSAKLFPSNQCVSDEIKRWIEMAPRDRVKKVLNCEPNSRYSKLATVRNVLYQSLKHYFDDKDNVLAFHYWIGARANEILCIDGSV